MDEQPFIEENKSKDNKDIVFWTLIIIIALAALYLFAKLAGATEVTNTYYTLRNFTQTDMALNTGEHVHVQLLSDIKKYPYIHWGNESVSCNYLSLNNWECIMTITPFMNGNNTLYIAQDEQTFDLGDYYFNGSLFYTTKNQCYKTTYNVTVKKNICHTENYTETKIKRICEVRNRIRTCEYRPVEITKKKRVCQTQDVNLIKQKTICYSS